MLFYVTNRIRIRWFSIWVVLWKATYIMKKVYLWNALFTYKYELEKSIFWNNVIVNLFTLVWTSFLIDLVTFYLFLMIYRYYYLWWMNSIFRNSLDRKYIIWITRNILNLTAAILKWFKLTSAKWAF